MIFQILFITACFALDMILGNLLPHSFIPGDFVITPCLGVSALVLVQRKMNQTDSILVSVIFGLLYDIYISNSFLVCTITFALISLLTTQWQKHITESLFESCLLVFATIFVKEFLVYFIMTLLSQTFMPISMWLTTRASLTLVFNGALVVFIVLLSRHIEDMMLMREKQIRKEETISWWKISSKP